MRWFMIVLPFFTHRKFWFVVIHHAGSPLFMGISTSIYMNLRYCTCTSSTRLKIGLNDTTGTLPQLERLFQTISYKQLQG